MIESLGEAGAQLPYEVSPTDSYNDGFDALGYDSREPVGLLGTLNFIIAITIARTLGLLLLRLVCGGKRGMKERLKTHMNGAVRLII